jgi:hypothetical protein
MEGGGRLKLNLSRYETNTDIPTISKSIASTKIRGILRGITFIFLLDSDF